MKGKKRVGVIVVDSEESPLWRSAKQKILNGEIYVINSLDFSTPISLAIHLKNLKPNFIIFTWREAFDQVIRSFIPNMLIKKINPSVFLLIPDFQGVTGSTEDIEEELKRINSADGVFVTCKMLSQRYSKILQGFTPPILYDFPSTSEISIVKRQKIKREANRVIWIGNSSWGKWKGHHDHKRLFSLAFPAILRAKSINEKIEFVTIDSSQFRMNHLATLTEIAKSSCLIMTSISEGTGLPLLEAAALGTPIVSVDVGIARELLNGELADQVVKPEIEIFAKKIARTLDESAKQSLLIRKAWNRFQHKIAANQVLDKLSKSNKGYWRQENYTINFLGHCLWYIRWLRQRIKN